MTSFEPIVRIDENAFRAHEKNQSTKMGRKPLSDMTNSKKLVAKGKSSSVVNFKAPEKVVQPPKAGRKPLTDLTNSPEKVVQPPKAGRKPLTDLTNSKIPPAQDKSSKTNCVGNISAAVNKEQGYSFAAKEGFLHNHNECIKANRKSMTMSMDYFLETVALKRDSTTITTPRLPQPSKESNLELEIPMEIEEMDVGMWDISTPASPEAPESPGWSMDFKNLEFSPLKLKDSPFRIDPYMQEDVLD